MVLKLSGNSRRWFNVLTPVTSLDRLDKTRRVQHCANAYKIFDLNKFYVSFICSASIFQDVVFAISCAWRLPQ